MAATGTYFASLDHYVKGGVEIIGKEDPKHYAFSNMFEISNGARPWERVVAAQNLEFVIEVVRAEGSSPWYVCSHDETVLVVQGAIETRFVKPDDAGVLPPEDKEGAVRLASEPAGRPMGRVRARRGHMTLLPMGAAYRIEATELGVLLIQTIKGEESVEKWAEICQQ